MSAWTSAIESFFPFSWKNFPISLERGSVAIFSMIVSGDLRFMVEIGAI